MENNAKPESSILVVTRTNDITADHVFHRMAARNIPYVRLNAENFWMSNIALQFPNVCGSTLTIENKRIAIDSIRGVWLRRITKPKADHIQNAEARAFAESEMDFTLRWLIDLLSNYCPVLDCETKILDGRNKFDQLAIAEKLGFRIPNTIVTNNPASAKEFVEQHETAVIKSVGGYGRQIEGGFYTVYTNIVTKAILDRFDTIRLAPVCLQEYVEKAFELRVTVVGQQVFGCRIDSQITEQTQVDWRRYNNKTPHSIYVINEQLRGRMIAMMQHYGIRLASFDLVVTPDDRTIFLEMNPATQFFWIEELTGMPIADAIIDEILSGFSNQ
jgi:glutathione synthase/RimK-type ligase-like ATP-grasp enzyme